MVSAICAPRTEEARYTKTRLELVTPARGFSDAAFPHIIRRWMALSGFAARLVETAEDRALWSRYGL